MNFEPGLFQSFDYFEPFRPNRVDQDIHLMRLDQKGGVTDPGDADFALTNLRKFRRYVSAGSLYKKRRNQNACQKIALVPIGAGPQTYARRMLHPWNWTFVKG